MPRSLGDEAVEAVVSAIPGGKRMPRWVIPATVIFWVGALGWTGRDVFRQLARDIRAAIGVTLRRD